MGEQGVVCHPRWQIQTEDSRPQLVFSKV